MKTIKLLILLASFVSTAASADYQCKNTEAGLELNLITFDTGLGLFSEPEPAAAVLKTPNFIHLYKGTSQSIQTRLGLDIFFELESTEGEEFKYKLIHSHTFSDVNFNNCTRAGCDPIIIKNDEILAELITVEGTQYELTCKSVVL